MFDHHGVVLFARTSRCGHLGGSCVMRGGFQIACSMPRVFLFLLLADLDVELSVPPPAPCLSALHYASHHADSGLNL